MKQYIGCSSARDAGAKVITYWVNSRKDVTYFGDVDMAKDNYIHKTESRMFQVGACTAVELKVKEGNKWV